jgi:hypothetical protein
MSDFAEAARLLSDVGSDPQQQERAMALFSTHTNLTAVVGLIQTAIDTDDIDGIDQYLDNLVVLVERHRKGHRPGQAAPRREYQGTVEVGHEQVAKSGVIRVDTDRFNLWLYPVGAEGNRRVQVEIEAK